MAKYVLSTYLYGTRYIESTSYEYDASKSEGIVIRTDAQGITYQSNTIQYNTNWQPVSQDFFKSYSKQASFRETSEYNDNQQLTYRKVEPVGIAGTECPDGKNYELFYDYSPNNLLKRITYKYKDVYCILNVKYE